MGPSINCRDRWFWGGLPNHLIDVAVKEVIATTHEAPIKPHGIDQKVGVIIPRKSVITH
jgi:hypothetical protein